MIGTVRGRELKKNRDGDHKVLLLKVEMTDNKDVQTIELMSQAGEDYSPQDGSKVFIVKEGEAWKLAIACDDGIEPSAAPGERILYSLGPGGAPVGKIHMKNTGELEFNNGTDYAVAYEDLKTAFDELKADFNAVVTLLLLHVHPGVTAGGASTGASISAFQSSTADMSGAKVNDMRLP